MGTGKLYNIGYVSSQWISSNTLHSYTISCSTFKGPSTGGGSATAAGGKYYVQYTDGTNLDSEGAFTYNETTNTLRISGAISSACISSGKITVSDFYVLGDTISGLRDPSYPSAASNKHYIDTVSGNLANKTIRGSMAGNIGSNYNYGLSGLKYISSQAISGQWRLPIYKTNKPAAALAYEGKMIMSSGAGTSTKSYIWVCCRNDANTYEWVMLGIST